MFLIKVNGLKLANKIFIPPYAILKIPASGYVNTFYETNTPSHSPGHSGYAGIPANQFNNCYRINNRR